MHPVALCVALLQQLGAPPLQAPAAAVPPETAAPSIWVRPPMPTDVRISALRPAAADMRAEMRASIALTR